MCMNEDCVEIFKFFIFWAFGFSIFVKICSLVGFCWLFHEEYINALHVSFHGNRNILKRM